MLKSARTWALSVLLLSPLACSRQQPAYTPGLGEIMSLNQMRHTKLWFAGQAHNWPLAAYELEELREGFADAVEFHPTHKDAPLPIAELIPKMTDQPLAQLEEAIAAQDESRFGEAFTALTAACNNCHQATNFGFNVVVTPRFNPYTNQEFAPPPTP